LALFVVGFIPLIPVANSLNLFLFSYMKKILFLIFLLTSISAFSQKQNHGLVHWLTLEEAQKKAKEQPRPILIDIYTDWCGWCKRMVATTYSDPEVAGYINQNFYPVQFNAETRDTIVYQGQKYVNREPQQNGTHQLTYKFLPESRSYPSTIFMTGDFQNTVNVPGYLESKTIAPILVFYSEKLYAETNINEFMAYFDSTFTPEHRVKQVKQVKWLSMQEALDKNLKSPRKIFVSLTTPDCISCRVMDSTTFTNPAIADYLNQNYYAVKFDATSKDTITILNQKLGSSGYYHTLVQAALKNQPELPALLFFNEKNELITPVPQYVTPKFLEAILVFFKKDVFMTKQFNDFYKDFKGTVK
jgi:thioredoxin-related protein